MFGYLVACWLVGICLVVFVARSGCLFDCGCLGVWLFAWFAVWLFCGWLFVVCVSAVCCLL